MSQARRGCVLRIIATDATFDRWRDPDEPDSQ